MTKEQECGHPKNTQHPCHLLENKQTLSDVEKIIERLEFVKNNHRSKGITKSKTGTVSVKRLTEELHKLKEAKE